MRGVITHDPDVLAVERMRRPAAELGPNWLDVVTGRAPTRRRSVACRRTRRARGGEHPSPVRGVQPHDTRRTEVTVESCVTVLDTSVS